MRLTGKQLICNTLCCVTLLGVILWALYAEYDRPWKNYQKEFSQYTHTVLKSKKSQRQTEEIHQIIPGGLGVVDRCTTCHQGVTRSGLENAPQPFRTHSGDYLKNHPVNRFGCVSCHDGEGPALTVTAAHGEGSNWTKPLLRSHYAQSSCGKCHFMNSSLPLSAELAGAPVFVQGWRLFKEYSCPGCHSLSGNSKPDRIGPDLTRIGNKVNKRWLRTWLKNPKDSFPETKMPRFTLSEEDIGYISDYLLRMQSPADRVETASHRPADVTEVKEGQSLVSELGCLGCHTLNGAGNYFGPDFSDIGNKVNPDWLYSFLKQPKAYDPATIIPDFAIAERDMPGIVGYLMSLKKETVITENINPMKAEIRRVNLRSPVTPGKDALIQTVLKEQKEVSHENIEKGKKLVKTLGCTGCHIIGNLPHRVNAPDLDGIADKRVDELAFNTVPDTEKTLINWLRVKIMDPGTFATDTFIPRMPNYDFTKEQAEALITFLMSINDGPVPPKYNRILDRPEKAEMKGRTVLEKYNCLGCHTIDERGGKIGPDLTREAQRSRPEWLFNFLKNPHKIRPAYVLKAGMPDFSLSDEDVNSLIEYFAFISRVPYPFTSEPRKETYRGDIWSGEKLYKEIFACSACHRVNGQGGEVGPDHTDLASRMNRTWIEQWLKNPQTIKPDVRMPAFTFKDWEFEALTNYLMTLGQYRFVQEKSED